MPPRHHRTVDRTVAILEFVARCNRPVSLAEIAQHLDAPKSSVQGLVNGLIATGYLAERAQRMNLGAGPFVLTLLGNRAASMKLTHEMLEDIYRELGHSVLAGIQLGDSLVYVDHIGENDVLGFVARNHSRRSLYATASGKIILSELPAREMDSFLLAAPSQDRHDVQAFLRELPEIRATKLAYNLGATVPEAVAVSTPLKSSQNEFVAAICVALDRELEPEITEIGEHLKTIVGKISV